MEYNQSTEKIIFKALELLEKGKSESEILSLFPEHPNEIKELFQTLATVRTAKDAIRPPKELLHKIISQIPDERTEHQENHLPYFGFATWIKFAVPTAAIAILAAVFYSKLLPENSQQLAEQTPTPVITAPAITQTAGDGKNQPTRSPEPTSLAAKDNIDDLINEAITLADNRQFVPDEDADASFINSDDQALDDLGKFYNEEEL